MVFPRIREELTHPHPPTYPLLTMNDGDGVGSGLKGEKGRSLWPHSLAKCHLAASGLPNCFSPYPVSPRDPCATSLSSEPRSGCRAGAMGSVHSAHQATSHPKCPFPLTPSQAGPGTGMSHKAQRTGRGALGIIEPCQPPEGQTLPRSCSHIQLCLCPQLTYLSGKS